ncbi:MAG: hypothetical protein JWR69_4584 [Pedosphaera sp.]|nr:hypothetical protein [Pedosphaera sp.]
MSVEMGITNKRTGEYRTVPVATLQAFRDYWLPASKALGLRLVSRLQDGSLTTVETEQIPVIVDELKRLRASVVDRQEYVGIIARIDGILQTFETTDSAESEYDFG